MATSAVNILLGISGVSNVVAGLGKVSTAVGGMMTSMGLGMATVTGAIRQGLELGTRMQHLSLRTGEAVRDLVALERAFERAGISAESVGLITDRVARAFHDQAATLRAYGVDVDRLAGAGLQAKLEALAGAIARIEDPAARSRLAMHLFGEAGGQMLQMLRDPGALRVAADETEMLGAVLERNAAKVDEVSQSLGLLRTRWREVVMYGTEAVLPWLDRAGRVVAGAGPGTGVLAGELGVGAIGLAMAGRFGTRFADALDQKMLDWATRSGPGLGTRLGNSIGTAFAGRFAQVFSVAMTAATAAVMAKAVADAWVAAQAARMDKAVAGIERAADYTRLAEAVESVGALDALVADLQGRIAGARALIAQKEAGWNPFDRNTRRIEVMALEQQILAYQNALLLLERDGRRIIARNQREAGEAARRLRLGMDIQLLGADVARAEATLKGLPGRGTPQQNDAARLLFTRDAEQRYGRLQDALEARQRAEGLHSSTLSRSQVVDQEKLAEALQLEQQINQVLQRRMELLGEIEDIEGGAFRREMRSFWADVARESDSGMIAARTVQGAFDGISGAISGAITGARSFGEAMRDVGRQVIGELIAMTARAMVFRAVMSSGLGRVLGIPATWMVGRAAGGPVLPGTSYLVGEQGPEILTMGATAGYITPNHAIGRAPAPERPELHVHVETGVAATVRAELAAALPSLAEAIFGMMADRRARGFVC